VLKEYADRYRDKIAGWWFDGLEPDTYKAEPGDWRAIHAEESLALSRRASRSRSAYVTNQPGNL
jgi:hypothetical protein